ncbi:YopX family protein [Staphylococcus xylosus]|uniref:YopX family protein n=1 Tax=Staphylococcus xylosus TaxID=1288 RepID=UPI000D1F6709|nr:YopX family protein [Staphylococcus xylosus]PTI25061.1 hypothetical protein BU115_07015 [Staphylococcus xylosus]
MIPKFRAWLKDREKIVDVVEIDYRCNCIIWINVKYTEIEDFKDIELLQSTGVKVMNGKEIFEGDVVKTNHGERGRHIGVVTFRPGEFISKGVKQYEGCIEKLHGEFEIIGNKYEHPHLLEE